MVNMINKKTIYCIAIFMIAVVALVLLPSNVNAVTISENGTHRNCPDLPDVLGRLLEQ